jgi:threonine dehydrogenase-like Zn-dependent dehydrogenase
MKGIALNRAGELELTSDLAEPRTAPGEVKIKMLAGGVCGSDLHSIASGVTRPSYPWPIGHEGGGVIVETGPGVDSLAAGDLVVIEPNFVCMKCYWCLSGRSKMCLNRVVIGAHVPGIFTEFATVPAPFAWKLAAGTPGDVIATVEPAVVAYGAVDRYLPASPRNALVIGAGSQGLLVIQRLVAAGITPAVSEPDSSNLAQAITHKARDVSEQPDERFDLVFETSGAAAGFTTALERAEKMGQICLIGQPSQPVPANLRTIVQKELSIQGHLIYNHPQDFQTAVTTYAQQPAPPIGLRDAVGPGQAVHDILAARTLPGKIWIDFENWS